MKNPFFTAGERKTLLKEDFQRKPDFEPGDLVVSNWVINTWARIFCSRLLASGQVMIVDKVWPQHFGNEIMGWKMEARFINPLLEGKTVTVMGSGMGAGSPTEGFINVTPFMKQIQKRLARNEKFGL